MSLEEMKSKICLPKNKYFESLLEEFLSTQMEPFSLIKADRIDSKNVASINEMDDHEKNKIVADKFEFYKTLITDAKEKNIAPEVLVKHINRNKGFVSVDFNLVNPEENFVDKHKFMLSIPGELLYEIANKLYNKIKEQGLKASLIFPELDMQNEGFKDSLSIVATTKELEVIVSIVTETLEPYQDKLGSTIKNMPAITPYITYDNFNPELNMWASDVIAAHVYIGALKAPYLLENMQNTEDIETKIRSFPNIHLDGVNDIKAKANEYKASGRYGDFVNAFLTMPMDKRIEKLSYFGPNEIDFAHGTLGNLFTQEINIPKVQVEIQKEERVATVEGTITEPESEAKVIEESTIDTIDSAISPVDESQVIEVQAMDTTASTKEKISEESPKIPGEDFMQEEIKSDEIVVPDFFKKATIQDSNIQNSAFPELEVTDSDLEEYRKAKDASKSNTEGAKQTSQEQPKVSGQSLSKTRGWFNRGAFSKLSSGISTNIESLKAHSQLAMGPIEPNFAIEADSVGAIRLEIPSFLRKDTILSQQAMSSDKQQQIDLNWSAEITEGMKEVEVFTPQNPALERQVNAQGEAAEPDEDLKGLGKEEKAATLSSLVDTNSPAAIETLPQIEDQILPEQTDIAPTSTEVQNDQASILEEPTKEMKKVTVSPEPTKNNEELNFEEVSAVLESEADLIIQTEMGKKAYEKYAFISKEPDTFFTPVRINKENQSISLYDFLEKNNILDIIPVDAMVITAEETITGEKFIRDQLVPFVTNNGFIDMTIEEYLDLYKIKVKKAKEKGNMFGKIFGRKR